ncbi:MAG: hypothetical protein ACK559_36720, partial [bacterium]
MTATGGGAGLGCRLRSLRFVREVQLVVMPVREPHGDDLLAGVSRNKERPVREVQSIRVQQQSSIATVDAEQCQFRSSVASRCRRTLPEKRQ